MATHSSILAWRIPWTEEPGGLQSTGRTESGMTEHTHTLESRDTARCPTTHRTVPSTKNYPTPSINNAEADILCPKPWEILLLPS